MLIKLVTTLVTVVIGIGAALVVYWILNKAAELLPGKAEAVVKPYLYILPAYAAIALYLLYPAVQTIVYSFMDETSTSFVGLDNFHALLTSHNFLSTLFNTLLWMIIVPTFTVIIGLAVATLADRLSPRGEKLSKTIIFLPMAISMVGASTVWRFVYNYRPAGQTQVGLQNALIGLVGHGPVAWLQQQAFHLNSLLLMVMLLWSGTGFAMVLLSAAVKGVPGDTLEAARIDGAVERQIFFRVIVPQIRGTIITVFVTTLIGVMKVFDVVYVMTNGSANTNVIGVEFFIQLYTNFNNGAAAAVVVLLMIATIPILIFQVHNFRVEEANA